MNILKRFFGRYDKEQVQKTIEATDYSQKKSDEFKKEMGKYKRTAIMLHNKTRQAHQDSVRINEIVNDVVSKIAIVTRGTV